MNMNDGIVSKICDLKLDINLERDNVTNENIFIMNDGSLYRYYNEMWCCLYCGKNGLGWYMSDRPLFNSCIPNFDVYHINTLRYCIYPTIDVTFQDHTSEGMNLYLVDNNNFSYFMLGHMYPFINNNNIWGLPFNISEQALNNLQFSLPLERMPIYVEMKETFTQEYSIPVFNTVIYDTQECQQENEVEVEVEVERRYDPFDNELYTKEEFIEYYGDSYLWKMSSPKKVSQRLMFLSLIKENNEHKIMTTKNINYLIDKMISTFM